MRLATIKLNGKEIAGIVTESGILPIAALNAAKGTAWKEEMYELICAQQVPGLTSGTTRAGRTSWRPSPAWCPGTRWCTPPCTGIPGGSSASA